MRTILMFQPKDDDSGCLMRRIGTDAREVDIERDERALLRSADGRDLVVRLAAEVLLENRDGIIPSLRRSRTASWGRFSSRLNRMPEAAQAGISTTRCLARSAA